MITFTIISAIICILIVFLILRNMYEYDYNGNPRERIKVPLYVYILTIIGGIIPIFNIIATIAFISWCIYECCVDDCRIKGPIGKIGKFLNKPL